MADYLDHINSVSTTPISEIKFNLLGGKSAVISENALAKYKSLYPELDIKSEFLKCSQKYNSGERRDEEGLRRYINNWFEFAERDRKREQKNRFSEMQNRNEPLSEEWWRELARKPGNLIGHIKVE